MMSRTARCERQPSLIRSARCGPIPSTSRRRSGAVSITSKTPAPNAATSRRAKCGPMPFSSPEARYFSSPSADVGAAVRTQAAWNCIPCVRSRTHTPPAWIASPEAMAGIRPTMVARSATPGARTRRTAKPLSWSW